MHVYLCSQAVQFVTVITARNVSVNDYKNCRHVYGRFKALELVVKKVLSHTDAAVILVAIVGILDVIHQIAAKQKLPKGPVIGPVMALPPSLEPGNHGIYHLKPESVYRDLFQKSK